MKLCPFVYNTKIVVLSPIKRLSSIQSFKYLLSDPLQKNLQTLLQEKSSRIWESTSKRPTSPQPQKTLIMNPRMLCPTLKLFYGRQYTDWVQTCSSLAIWVESCIKQWWPCWAEALETDSSSWWSWDMWTDKWHQLAQCYVSLPQSCD